MIYRIHTLLIFITLSLSLTAQKEEYDNRYSGNKNKPEREEWLRDLGFGMFIHYTVDSQLGIVPSHSMVGATDEYTNRFINDLPKTFNPARFDAYKIAMMAKLAGMKYVVFTTKHHSGFCMWDTKTTDFKITNTPYKKDLLKEYVEGVRKAGLAVGFYFSPEDFKFLYDHKAVVKRGDIKLDDKTWSEYIELIRAQTRELFTDYGKIDIFFIDGEPKEPCKEEVWKLQPECVITRGAINTPEQYIPGTPLDMLWESCITMGTEWTYKPTNDVLKSGSRLIELLIDTRTKGGNLLLNVGPHPEGFVPIEQESRLLEISAWYFINKEAIDNVRPWIIPREENISFTVSKDKKTLYGFIMGYPEWKQGERKEFVLHSVKATSGTKISVLGQNDLVVEYQNDVNPKSGFTQKEDGLHISVVRAQRIYSDYAWPNPITFKLENIEKALEPPVVSTTGSLVKENSVLLSGKALNPKEKENLKGAFEYHIYEGFSRNIQNVKWTTTNPLSLDSNGEFSILLNNLEKGSEYEFRAIIHHPLITIRGEIKRFKF